MQSAAPARMGRTQPASRRRRRAIARQTTASPSTNRASAIKPDAERLQLADAVERVAASVVGLPPRRMHSAGVLWRAGVVVVSASALWRSHRVPVVLPD